MKIYFAGQDNFGNRGCEALIRANVKTIRSVLPEAEFFVPSRRIDLDRQQWPQAAEQGVRFVGIEPLPSIVRWWGRLRRRIAWLENHPPKIYLTNQTRDLIGSSDVVLMTGGDNISLDYDLESLYFWTGLCDAAMKMGKPVVLWAGSVGPFSRQPSAERLMRSFLGRLALITVRETASYQYLQGLGLSNVELVTDPAFVLEPELAPKEILCRFESGRPVLGFNVSPLILKFRESAETRQTLDSELVSFLANVVREKGMDVLLIPHVDPLDGSGDNSDWVYMSRILQMIFQLGVVPERASILPRGLNAAQLKDVIRRCTFFMGARTHSTVAALSQCVPTTSIAYSVKAKGINQDLFGHIRYVLDTPAVNQVSLHEHLELLLAEQENIRNELATRMLVWRKHAGRSAQLLPSVLSRSNA